MRRDSPRTGSWEGRRDCDRRQSEERCQPDGRQLYVRLNPLLVEVEVARRALLEPKPVLLWRLAEGVGCLPWPFLVRGRIWISLLRSCCVDWHLPFQRITGP